MSCLESKELMKLFKCSTDVATQVVCALADSKLLHKYGGNFKLYLDDNKHYFYHQWEQKNTACCECPPAGRSIRRMNRMDNWIFNSFYMDTGIVDYNHVIKEGGIIKQRCLHKYITRNIRLDHLDITVLYFVLVSSGTLNGQEKTAIETIFNKRNSICHAWSTKCFSMIQLHDMWTDVESAVSTLTNPYMISIVQSQIQSLRKYEFDNEEMALLSTSLDKLNTKLDEIGNKIPPNNNNIANMELRLTQISQQNSENIKQHISKEASHFFSQAQLTLSQEIKDTVRKERQELEGSFENIVSFQHMIDNHSFTVLYDRHVNVLVPEETFKGSQECPVLWQMTTPKGWDLEEVVATLKDATVQDATIQEGVVKVKYVKKGSLIIMTTITANILNDQKSFETAVKSFLNKIVDVCHINTKVKAQVDVRLHILNSNEVKLHFEVPKTRCPSKDKFVQTDMTKMDIETMERERDKKIILCAICCELGEQFQATCYCLDCKNPEPLCSSCADDHKVMKRTKDHQLSTEISKFPKSHGPNPFRTDFSNTSRQNQNEQKSVQTRLEKNPYIMGDTARTPGKPYVTDKVNRSDHIFLKWEYDGKMAVEELYEIKMKQHTEGKWRNVHKYNTCIHSFLTIDGLKPETSYVFKVRVVNATTGEEGLFGPESDVITTGESHAIRIMRKSTKINDNIPAVYELPVQEVLQTRNAESHTRRFILGNPRLTTKDKTIMMVGATGSGKSTLVNAIANYVMGVTWEDPFRFTLIKSETCEHERVGNEALSQTDSITCYTLCSDVVSRIDYTISIIDTPGFGDTRGLEQDAKIVSHIRDLFTSTDASGVATLDAVCFILKAPDARLTTTQKYIFESVLSLFGNDIKNNICTLVTFADGNTPPVLAALGALEGTPLPYQTYFSFNNSAVFVNNTADPRDHIPLFFWKMGMRSCCDFFQSLDGLQTRSLLLTSEVLIKRQKLKNMILHLQEEIELGLSKINLLEEQVNIFTKYKRQIQDNENFEYVVEESKMEKVDTNGQGIYTTTCLICNCVCHNNCACINSSKVDNCCAFGSDGYCSECPKNCHWAQHSKVPYILQLTTKKIRKTYFEMKYRYQQAHQMKISQEEVLKEIHEEIKVLEVGIQLKIEDITEYSNRLNEIALRPDLISTVRYIELMIETELLEKHSGFNKRVETLQKCKRRAEIGKTFQIFEERLQDTRAAMKSSTSADYDMSYDRNDRNMFKKANDKFKQLIYGYSV